MCIMHCYWGYHIVQVKFRILMTNTDAQAESGAALCRRRFLPNKLMKVH